jgi:ATP-dependent exoDNAse (exonuclease V) beta subunit
LRSVGLPTYRAAGRGYYGQQQVVDLLAYLRLIHNRYDDEALVTVLASPLVGVSNDALVLLRRSAGRRPLFCGLERSVPAGLADRDERLFRAFRQRYDRLTRFSSRAGLERLCEAVVAEHDYDLAVLAQWDGRRRYANVRKLGRLARSYQELRGPDIEGFVRFMRDQDAAGAREVEAFAEEEGADAVRLLTIHAAKGLEFKVVVVADAGRDRLASTGEEILCLPDGRFGFKVADPLTGRRRGAFDYEAVLKAEETAEDAERRRLYYVAMTRAMDRLIVSGALDPGRTADERTPIGWVLQRLGGVVLGDVDGDPVVLERGEARLLLRANRPSAEQPTPEPAPVDETGSQLTLFSSEELFQAGIVAPVLPPLGPIPEPPIHDPRRLSFSALATFDQCSYKYYARYVAGMREREDGAAGLGALGVGSAVHEVLETLDLAAPVAPENLAARFPRAGAEELTRIESFVTAYCESELAARLARLEGLRVEQSFAFEHDGVVLHGYLDVCRLTNGRALVVDYKTNALDGASPRDLVETEYRLQRLVYALACLRAGAEEVEVVYLFLERPGEPVSTIFSCADVEQLEAELSGEIARIREGRFVPTPSEFACAGCPALGVVCAGPGLR